MPRAVHRLEPELSILVGGDEDVLLVLAPVTAGLPEMRLVELRRIDLDVTALRLHLTVQVDQLVVDRRPLGQPEGGSGRDIAEREQPQLAAELAMVAGARLLEQGQVLLELFVRVERGAVDAGEHLAIGVAAPVGAGDRREFERLDRLRRGRVRALTQVRERAVRVERNGFHPVARHQVVDELDLVVLPLAGEALPRDGHRNVLADELLGRLHVLAHPRLDRLEIGLGDGDAVRELEVVVEALLDRRADGDLHARIELRDRGRQHVRGVVPDERQRVRVLRGDDLDRRAVLERPRQVAQLSIHLDRKRRARQARTDGGSGVGATRALGQV